MPNLVKSQQVVKKIKKSAAKRKQELQEIQEDKGINIELFGTTINIGLPQLPGWLSTRTVVDFDEVKISIDI